LLQRGSAIEQPWIKRFDLLSQALALVAKPSCA
jgi:hypothetical protein